MQRFQYAPSTHMADEAAKGMYHQNLIIPFFDQIYDFSCH